MTFQLSSIQTQVRKYGGEIAEFVDKAVDDAAGHVRDALATAPWIPENMRPSCPPPPAVEVIQVSALERMQNWVARNKILSIVFVAGVAYVSYRTVRQGKLLRKTRRAKRARNGGRLEVIVIAGSPTLPLTKSLALDMERKGFIVYIVCNSIEDDALVQNMSRPDIKPLGIDITDVSFLVALRGFTWGFTWGFPLYIHQIRINLVMTVSPRAPAPASNVSPPTCKRPTPPSPGQRLIT